AGPPPSGARGASDTRSPVPFREKGVHVAHVPASSVAAASSAAHFTMRARGGERLMTTGRDGAPANASPASYDLTRSRRGDTCSRGRSAGRTHDLSRQPGWRRALLLLPNRP